MNCSLLLSSVCWCGASNLRAAVPMASFLDRHTHACTHKDRHSGKKRLDQLRALACTRLSGLLAFRPITFNFKVKSRSLDICCQGKKRQECAPGQKLRGKSGLDTGGDGHAGTRGERARARNQGRSLPWGDTCPSSLDLLPGQSPKRFLRRHLQYRSAMCCF